MPQHVLDKSQKPPQTVMSIFSENVAKRILGEVLKIRTHTAWKPKQLSRVIRVAHETEVDGHNPPHLVRGTYCSPIHSGRMLSISTL